MVGPPQDKRPEDGMYVYSDLLLSGRLKPKRSPLEPTCITSLSLPLPMKFYSVWHPHGPPALSLTHLYSGSIPPPHHIAMAKMLGYGSEG